MHAQQLLQCDPTIQQQQLLHRMLGRLKLDTSAANAFSVHKLPSCVPQCLKGAVISKCKCSC